MTILTVNGGGNTPNGEAARGDDLSKSYLPMESLRPADSPDTSSTATFLQFEFDGEYNGDGSVSLLGTSDALATSELLPDLGAGPGGTYQRNRPTSLNCMLLPERASSRARSIR